jgi:hypothetical protein
MIPAHRQLWRAVLEGPYISVSSPTKAEMEHSDGIPPWSTHADIAVRDRRFELCLHVLTPSLGPEFGKYRCQYPADRGVNGREIRKVF